MYLLMTSTTSLYTRLLDAITSSPDRFSSAPLKSLKRPPASLTRMMPAAMSQG